MTRLLALLGPLSVITAWLWLGGFFAPGQEGAALRPRTPMLGVLQRLAEEPEVLVFGNSQAQAVDLDAVGEALGVPGRVGSAVVGGSAAPLAWAIARHRVFDAGLRPRLLLVPMSVTHLLDTAVPEGKHLSYVQQMLLAPDPVLDDKVFGHRDRRLDSVVATLQTWREGLLERVTALPLHLLDVEPAERMDRARDAVFGQVAGAQLVLNARMIPIVEGGSAAKGAAADIDLDRTLIPDLLALAAEYNVHVVFVTLPQQARHLVTPRPLLQRLVAFVADHGGAFVHLEGLAIPSDGWLDSGHLNPRGSEVLTEALIQALDEMDAMSDGPLKRLPPPLDPPLVQRRGDPAPPRMDKVIPTDNPCLVKVPIDGARHLSDPATLDAGLGYASPLVLSWRGKPLHPHTALKADTPCVGAFSHARGALLVSPPEPGLDVGDLVLAWSPDTPHTRRVAGTSGTFENESWWPPAGGVLALQWPEPIVLGQGSELRVLLTPAAEGDSTWSIAVGSEQVQLSAWESLRYTSLPLPAGPLATLEIRASPGSPDAFLRSLVLVQGSAQSWIAGRPEERSDRLALVAGDSLDPAKALPERLVAERSTAFGSLLTWPVEGYDAALTQSRTVVAANDPQFGRFLPFEGHSLIDGAVLDLRTRQSEPGTIWSMFHADMPRPATDDTWSLHVHHSRARARHLWIHPGEDLTIHVRRSQALAVTADTLELALAAFGSQGQVGIRFLGPDEEVRVQATLDASKLDGTPLTFLLSSPIAPAPDRLTLQITAPADSWVLLGPSLLRSQFHPPDAWFAVEPPPTPRVQARVSYIPPPQQDRLFDLAAWLPDGLGGFTRLPADEAVVSAVAGDGGPGIRLSGPPGTRPIVCLPDIPTTRAVESTAQIRIADATEPGVGVLDLRWTVAGHAVRDVRGKTMITDSRVMDLGADWQTVTLVAPPVPGTAAVRLCLRREGTGDLEVGGWTVRGRETLADD